MLTERIFAPFRAFCANFYRFLALGLTVLCAILMTACGGGAVGAGGNGTTGGDPSQPPPQPNVSLNQAVNHIIVMVQENRSFDQYFGKLPDYWAANGFASVNLTGCLPRLPIPERMARLQSLLTTCVRFACRTRARDGTRATWTGTWKILQERMRPWTALYTQRRNSPKRLPRASQFRFSIRPAIA